MSDTMTQTSAKTCAACAYWKDNDGTSGECRRHAPQSIVIKLDGKPESVSSFPVTASKDWCGDFEPK